jgi:hypothetical protein
VVEYLAVALGSALAQTFALTNHLVLLFGCLVVWV